MQIQIERVKGSRGGVGDKKYARYRGRGGGQRSSREPFRPFDQSLFGGKWGPVNGDVERLGPVLAPISKIDLE